MVSGSPYDTALKLQLSSFDAIVFIGQFIQPQRIISKGMNWHNEHSRSVLEEFFEYTIENPPRGKGLKSGYNEPLQLFPSLTDAAIVLLPDPYLSARDTGFGHSPSALVSLYYSALSRVCSRRRISLCWQPESTIGDCFTTIAEYDRSSADTVHKSKEFWSIVFRDSIRPTIEVLLR